MKNRYLYLLLIAVLPLALMYACKKEHEDCPPEEEAVEERFCNGHPELCGKRYNEVAIAMTHNSHADTDEFSSLAANQNGTTYEQLEAGIRGIGVKVYDTGNILCSGASDDLYCYHGDPIFGCAAFSRTLTAIHTFFQLHTEEVVTLTIEGDASPGSIMNALTASGLDEYLHEQDFNEPWPTMEEMIDSGKKLVVFMDDGSATDPYPAIHDMWNFFFDTNYNHSSPSTFDCDKDRGNHTTGQLFLFNHFITDLSPQPDDAAIINQIDFLLPRARSCWSHNNHIPNFVFIDFYATGDVVEVVDSLNLNGL